MFAPLSSIQRGGVPHNTGPIAAGRNINCRTNAGAPNTKIDINADEILLEDTNGNIFVAKNVAGTIDFGTIGVNGLDTSTQQASTWYYGWVIAKENGVGVALLGSTSSTAPTLPAGYTFKALVTAARSGAATQFIKYRQFGNWCYYEALQNALSAGVATVETAVSTATQVPPNALAVLLTLGGIFGATAGGSYSAQVDIDVVTGSTYARFPTAVQASGTGSLQSQCTVPNLGQNVYYFWNGTVNLTSQSLNIWVTGFQLPGGGE